MLWKSAVGIRDQEEPNHHGLYQQIFIWLEESVSEITAKREPNPDMGVFYPADHLLAMIVVVV